MKNRILLFAICFFILIDCRTKRLGQQNTISNVSEPSITLDTVSISAEETKPKKSNYRASTTQTNDVLHTKLDVSFDWEKAQLIGHATIKLKPYFYPTNMLYLDARGMEIKEVSLQKEITTEVSKGKTLSRMEKTTLNYIYENDSLKITLDKTYTAKEEYVVYVDYVSKPNELKKVGGSAAINSDKGLYFINPKGEDPNKMPQIWTQGETQSNSVWFPTIDSPNEKMTNEIYMTVDDKYTTLSNGTLVSQTKNTDGTRTDYWKMDLPHAPYLVMMGVGEFKKVTDKPWNGKEVSYYVEKEYEPHALAIFGDTPEMIDFFSKKLGVSYPWQKYSQIVARDYVSGAMENTTATLHGDFMVYQTTRETLDKKRGESVIAHELFHQWFGDLVTSESWSNLPLNESFATYGEYLWFEYKHGRDAADDHSYASRQGYFASAKQKQVDLVRFHYADREDMFDAFSYNKGGQVLHMLRKYVGDDAFFASLQLYLEKNKFKPAEMHHLRLAFEEVTGEDLNWFFNQWFYAKGHPVLDVTKSYDTASKQLVVKLEQKQDFKEAPLYRLPMNIDVYYGGKKETKRIWLEEATQEFIFKDITAVPDLVNVDAERQLLAEINYEKTLDELVFQYKSAPLYLDRKEALDAFLNNESDTKVYFTLMGAAKNDKWEGHRIKAMDILSQVKDSTKLRAIKLLLMDIALNDKKTGVRAEAIKNLSDNYKDEDLNSLFNNALQEQSYAIVSEALMAIEKRNPKLALQKAKEFQSESGTDVLYAVADIYSKHGTDENNVFFVKSQTKFNGFEAIGFVAYYGLFLKRTENAEIALSGAKLLASMAKSGTQYVKYYAQAAIKNYLVNTWQDKETKQKGTLEKAKKDNQPTQELESKLASVTATKNELLTIYTNSLK